MGKLVIPSIVVNGGSGGGGSATWGGITGTLSNQTDLQDALNNKIGIVEGELKVSDGDNIVVDVEDDSTTEIFSDGINISSYGDDSEGSTIYVDGINGARIDVVTDTNQINIVTDSNGANISKTENNITEKVLWNKATGTNSITILGYSTNQFSSINIGRYSIANGSSSLAIGGGANASASSAVAIGAAGSYGNKAICINCNGGNAAIAQAQESIQLGYGTNNNAKTFQVYEYQLLDGNTGKIPAARLPAPILTWYKNNTGSSITIADTSSANLVKVYKNGVLLEPTEDYIISGTTLTLTVALETTDKITTEVF